MHCSELQSRTNIWHNNLIQYLCFCTSKASPFVPVKQVLLCESAMNAISCSYLLHVCCSCCMSVAAVACLLHVFCASQHCAKRCRVARIIWRQNAICCSYLLQLLHVCCVCCICCILSVAAGDRGDGRPKLVVLKH
jgi:hypothetical protein